MVKVREVISCKASGTLSFSRLNISPMKVGSNTPWSNDNIALIVKDSSNRS